VIISLSKKRDSLVHSFVHDTAQRRCHLFSLSLKLHLNLLIIVFIALIASNGWSATYYVSMTDGNDNNNGQVTLTPWKSIAKVNASIFNPGDQILFKRGEIWREQLIPISSGKTGLPIYYGAYGVGNKPSIRGSNIFNVASNWTQESMILWYLSSIPKDPGIFVHDDILGQRKPQKTALNAQWDYWYDSVNTRLYIYSTVNPVTLSAKLEVSVREYSIGPQSTSYITFDNLDMRHTNNMGWLGWGATNIIFQNCNFTQSGGDHVLFHNGSNYGLVINCTFNDWGVNDGQFYAVHTQGYNATATGPVDVKNSLFTTSTTIAQVNGTEHSVVMQDYNSWIRNVQGNRIDGNSGKISHDGIVIWDSSYDATIHLIESNTITNIGGLAIIVQQLENHGAHPVVTIRYNIIENVSLSDSIDKSAIRLKTFTSDSNVSVYYNIINGTKQGTYNHAGIDVYSASGAKIYNNIIYAVDDGITVRQGSGGISGMNNIITNNRGHGIQVQDTSAITADYNCVFGNILGNYTGFTSGTHNIIMDPLFKNAVTGNFHLAKTSPCRDIGVFVGLTQDIAGHPVPFGLGPDIGAFEEADITSSPPAPPANLRVL